MFCAGSVILVYDSVVGGICNTFIDNVEVGDLVYTVNRRFCPVTEKISSCKDHCGVLISENGLKLRCFYRASFMGYDEVDGETQLFVANEMRGRHWKCYDEQNPHQFIFDKVIDWRPYYKFVRKELTLRSMQLFSLVVANDHSFFVNGVAVYDNSLTFKQ
jgi:hypothetical protein